MKTLKILLAILMTCSATTLLAQVQIDKPIQLTGGTGQRVITNLETPVNGTDAANKDYVDAAVAAGGGSITMLSDESVSLLNYGDAMRYCNTLNESGFTDWHLPTFEELSTVFSKGGVSVTDNTSANYIWFQPQAYGSTSAMLASIRLSDGEINGQSIGPLAATQNVRCVR